MAITKIHPIKSTLNLAIDYIVNGDKTDEQLLVSTHKCHESTAHTQFLRTRNDAGTKGTVLARHLIQSFLPGETSPELAHQIGMELCKKILKDEYEFVLSTHVDKGHIHNHIIFNNVNMITGRCYQSNKKNYHQIRYQSDKLCKDNNLSVIDEFYESYKRKYKTNGKSWYENEQSKKGISWKSRLQFDIDRLIKQSKDWEEFLKKMAELGYEIKHGKHIAFKPKDKQRFTRSKTIGEDYTEEKLRERITENQSIKAPPVKKRIGNVIDMNTNAKVKESKGYEYWATKHNLHTMAESVIYIREHGIKSVKQQLMKGKIYKRKSKLLIRKCRSFPPLWSKFIPLKNTERATRNILLIRLTRHFLKSTKLRLPYMKMLSQSLKNLIPSSQIQRIFYLNLINYKIKRIPSCKSILPQNPLWTSFIRYEKITEFIWVRRWRDNLYLLFSQIKKSRCSPKTTPTISLSLSFF